MYKVTKSKLFSLEYILAASQLYTSGPKRYCEKDTVNLALIDLQLHFHTVLIKNSKKIQNLSVFLTYVYES